MPIMCNSPMRADPTTISLPGGATLTFDAVANPVTTDADIIYTILPSGAGVCFANGTKRDQVRQRVSAAGTTIVHQARFVRCTGAAVAALDVRAEVSEAAVPQCSRTTTIGVRARDDIFSFEFEVPAAAAPTAVPKRSTARKSAKRSTKKSAQKSAQKSAKQRASKKPKRPTRRTARKTARRKRPRRL